MKKYLSFLISVPLIVMVGAGAHLAFAQTNVQPGAGDNVVQPPYDDNPPSFDLPAQLDGQEDSDPIPVVIRNISDGNSNDESMTVRVELRHSPETGVLSGVSSQETGSAQAVISVTRDLQNAPLGELTFYVHPAPDQHGEQEIAVSLRDEDDNYDPLVAIDRTWIVRTVTVSLENVNDPPTFARAAANLRRTTVSEAPDGDVTYLQVSVLTDLSPGPNDPTDDANLTVQETQVRLLDPSSFPVGFDPESETGVVSSLWSQISPFGVAFDDTDADGDGDLRFDDLLKLRLLPAGCSWPPANDNALTEEGQHCSDADGAANAPTLRGLLVGDAVSLGVSVAPDVFFGRIEAVLEVRDGALSADEDVTVTFRVTPTNDRPFAEAPAGAVPALDSASDSVLWHVRQGGVINDGTLTLAEGTDATVALRYVSAGPREYNQDVHTQIAFFSQGLVTATLGSIRVQNRLPIVATSRPVRGDVTDELGFLVEPHFAGRNVADVDYFGPGVLSVTLRDGPIGGSGLTSAEPLVLHIEVTPVNDPPRVISAPDLTVIEDAAPDGERSCGLADQEACATVQFAVGPENERGNLTAVVAEFPAEHFADVLLRPLGAPSTFSPAKTVSADDDTVLLHSYEVITYSRADASNSRPDALTILIEGRDPDETDPEFTATATVDVTIVARDDRPWFVNAFVADSPGRASTEQAPVVLARPYTSRHGTGDETAWVQLFPSISLNDPDLTRLARPGEPSTQLVGHFGSGGAPAPRIIVSVVGDDQDTDSGNGFGFATTVATIDGVETQIAERAPTNFEPDTVVLTGDYSAVTVGTYAVSDNNGAALTLTLGNIQLRHLVLALRALRYRDEWIKPPPDGRRTIVLTYDDGGDTNYELQSYFPANTPLLSPVAMETTPATVFVAPADSTTPVLTDEQAESFVAEVTDNVATLRVAWRTADSDMIDDTVTGASNWLSYRLYIAKSINDEVLERLRRKALEPRPADAAPRTDADPLSGYFWARRSWLRPELQTGFGRLHFVIPENEDGEQDGNGQENQEGNEPELVPENDNGFNRQLLSLTLTRDEVYFAPGSFYTLHLEVCDTGENCTPYNRITLATAPAPDVNGDGVADNVEAFLRASTSSGAAAIFDRYTAPYSSTQIVDIVASAAILRCGSAYADTDADGVPNNIEIGIGTDCTRAGPDDFIGNVRPVLLFDADKTIAAGGVETPVDPTVRCLVPGAPEGIDCAEAGVTLTPYYRSVEGDTTHGPYRRMQFPAGITGDLCALSEGVPPGNLPAAAGCEVAGINNGAAVFLPSGDSQIWWTGRDSRGNWAVVQNDDGDTDFASQSFRLNPLLVVGPSRQVPHSRWARITLTVAAFGEDCSGLPAAERVTVTSSITARQPIPELVRTVEIAPDAADIALVRPANANYGCNAADEATVSVFMGGCAIEGDDAGCEANPSRVRDGTVYFQPGADLYEGDHPFASPVSNARGRGVAISAALTEIPPEMEADLFYNNDGGVLTLVAGMFEPELEFNQYSIRLTFDDIDAGDVSLSMALDEDSDPEFRTVRVGMQTISILWTVRLDAEDGSDEPEISVREARVSYDLDLYEINDRPADGGTTPNTPGAASSVIELISPEHNSLIRNCMANCSSHTPRLNTAPITELDQRRMLLEQRTSQGRLLTAGYRRISLYMNSPVTSEELPRVQGVEVNATVWSRGLDLHSDTTEDGQVIETLTVVDVQTEYPPIFFPVVRNLPAGSPRFAAQLRDVDNDGVPDVIDGGTIGATDGPTLLWSGARPDLSDDAEARGCLPGGRCLQSSPDTSLRLGPFAAEQLRAAIESDGLGSIARNLRFSLLEDEIYDFEAKLPGVAAQATVVIPIGRMLSSERVMRYQPLIGGSVPLFSDGACEGETEDRVYWAPIAPLRSDGASRGICPAPAPDSDAWRCGTRSQAGDACLMLVIRDGGENDILGLSRDINFRVSGTGGVRQVPEAGGGGGGGGGATGLLGLPLIGALIVLAFVARRLRVRRSHRRSHHRSRTAAAA